MSVDPAPRPLTPRVDARAVLGLYDPSDSADWGVIRAAQLAAGGQTALPMLAANLAGAVAVAMAFAHVLPMSWLAGWSVATAIIAVTVVLRRLSARRRSVATATRENVQLAAIDGIALAVAWSVPSLFFARHGSADTQLLLWMVTSVLMTTAAVAMAALSLATFAFLILLGTASVASLALSGAPGLAGIAATFTAVSMIACLVRSRGLVQLRVNEIALSERDETVSLLLRESEQEENAADWLWETDAQRRVVRASPRFARSMGIDPVAIDGMSMLEVLAGPAWEAGNFPPGLSEFAERLKTREAFRDLPLPILVRGEERWIEMSASPRRDEAGAFLGFRGVGSDVTDKRRSDDKINRMARFDQLTGLPNRLLIHEAIGRAMAEAEKWGSRCAFMMIDLDRFKAINDTLGHLIGDRLLGRVSERLKRLMTDDEMIGRLGGDEFAVVVRNGTDMTRLEQLAQRIIASLSEPYDVDQHTLYIGASVGIAIGPRDGRTPEMLIRAADLALYRSKDAGGGEFHTYEPQLHIEAEERRVLEIALRNALERDQLTLNFQPVVDATTTILTGFEALLRWTHPELGTISPAKFVPLAEDARLIVPIGEWVLRTACREAAQWDAHVRIAVNVSAEQLHAPGFVTVVAQTLAQTGLDPARLELEVTESVFMREGTAATQTLERLLDLGVHLSLDDFGTGYSSLGYLSRTRFSSIKIDRSFVQSASRGVKESVAIIRAVVALARSLGMATTAEGVETETEHHMVHDLGCTKVQGFYFGRPLPVEEARRLIDRLLDANRAA